jgi:hypothetical protein
MKIASRRYAPLCNFTRNPYGPELQVKQMFDGRFNRLTASLIRRIRAKFLAQIKRRKKMKDLEFYEALSNPLSGLQDDTVAP